ncbi:MAG: carotenoid biosynthesis protein [Bacillota bacterium]
MERQKILNNIDPFLIILLIYIVGLVGHLSLLTLPWMIKLTPFTLLLTGFLVIISLKPGRNPRLIFWCTGVFILTFLMEIAGVYSGYIFGNYQYGNVLGLKLLGVPFVIGFNWMLILLGCIIISRRIFSDTLNRAILTALIAVIFDLVMEPVAIRLSYWQWIDGSVPLQNYLAWGIFAFASSLAFDKLEVKAGSSYIPARYLIVQFIFFLCLNIFGLN